MARYIDAEKIVYWVRYVSSNGLDSDVRRVAFSDEIARMPAADVVSKEMFEQVNWERDMALKTLEEHGIGLGQKADAAEVKHGEWLVLAEFTDNEICTQCSVCGEEYTYKTGRIGELIKNCYAKYNYCPNCGTKMDGERSETK